MTEVTDELVDAWCRVNYPLGLNLSNRQHIEGMLQRALDAGWTIEPPPEPRYYAEGYWVRDRATGQAVALFYSDVHPDPKGAAEREAAYLNSTRGGDR